MTFSRTNFLICIFLIFYSLIFAFKNSEDIEVLNRFQRINKHEQLMFSNHSANNNTSYNLGIIKDDFLLNDDTTSGARQENPCITINHSGNVAITWTDFRDGNADVYCQRFDVLGNILGPNFRVNADAGMMWQGEPSIASDNHGNFVVTWEDRRYFNSDVYVQRYNEQGIPVDTNFRANDNTGTSDQRNTSVIFLPNRDFIIVWDDWRNDWGDIYGQCFDSSGNPQGVNFRINDDTPGSNQYSPSIACDSFGNFVVVWMDGRQGDWDIYAQRYNNQGIRLGINFRVNDDGTSVYQGDPKVSRTQDGKFIVVWEDQRLENSDIYCQRFDAVGNRLGVNFKVNDDIGSATQNLPDIANDGSGNFIITWADTRLGNYDIFAQRYNYTGTGLGQNFKVNDDATNQTQSEPTIAIASSGNFWIAWKDNRQLSNDIYLQKFESNGTPNGINIKVNDEFAGSNQRCSWIAQDGFGNYVTTWEDERNSNCDIYGTRFDSLGNFLGNNFRINDDLTNTEQYYASVATNFNGDFVVAWTDGRNNNFDIYAQRYSRTGIPIGNNFRVNDDTTQASQWYPITSCDSIGNIIIVWMDYRNGDNDIYGQRYNYSGNPIGNNFIINNQVNGSQIYPFVARNQNGTFVVAWMDDRNGNFDIFAQRFDNFGIPIGSNFKVNDDISTMFQGYPGITIDLFGNFYIVWEDERNENTDIYMQRYNFSGIPIANNIRVNEDNSGQGQYSPTISCDEIGKYIIVWCDFRNGDDDPEIYSQAFLASGDPFGNNKMVNQSDLFPGNNQWLIGQGVVANSGQIGFAWIDNRRHRGWDIYSKIVDWNYFSGLSEENDQISISSNAIKIFPNPNTGKIFLTSNRKITGDIDFFNSVGRKIKTISDNNLPNKPRLEIDLSWFKSGVYFLQYNLYGIPETKKIILNTRRKSVEN